MLLLSCPRSNNVSLLYIISGNKIIAIEILSSCVLEQI